LWRARECLDLRGAHTPFPPPASRPASRPRGLLGSPVDASPRWLLDPRGRYERPWSGAVSSSSRLSVLGCGRDPVGEHERDPAALELLLLAVDVDQLVDDLGRDVDALGDRADRGELLVGEVAVGAACADRVGDRDALGARLDAAREEVLDVRGPLVGLQRRDVLGRVPAARRYLSPARACRVAA
jgi:hypothetical protein